MRALFEDILAIEDVHGVFFVSLRGNLIFREFDASFSDHLDLIDWPVFVDAFSGIREAELVYRDRRIFFRSTELGYVFIVMGWYAHIALVRLNCSQALPMSAIKPD